MERKLLKDNIIKPVAILANYLRKRSIQFIITAAFMFVTILAIIFVGITLYSKFSNLSEQNAAINTRQIVDQVNLNLQYYLESMMEVSNSLDNLINYNSELSKDKLVEQMNVILSTRKDIVTLAVFSEQGQQVVGVPISKIKANAKLPKQDWFTSPLDEPANLFFSSPHVQNIYESKHNWVVSLSREITFNDKGKNVHGVLLVDMNFSSIEQLCQKVALGNKGYIYLIDSNGNIVYHPQQLLINTGLKTENINEIMKHVFGKYFDKVNGETRLITIQTINYTRWRIIGVAYMDEITAAKKEIASFAIWVLALTILTVISISAFISAKISQPIKRLEKSMKLVEQGRFDITIDIKGEMEVAQLSKTFNLMVSKIRYLMEQIVHEQESKRKSELDALQAQINPHFLYNTLDSIVWMAEKGKSPDVITMVTALARLFRISISRGKSIISVQEELEHARNYLIIQKIRYKSKFNYEIEVEEQALQFKTIKLILQPIIENAIYHGIEHMVDEGLIKIFVKIAEGKLLYQVSDNGLGMSLSKLKNILTIGINSKEGSGVGVKNVHERIQLTYGKEFGLQILSEQEVGTVVNIWLPLIED
jgi:two-component system, sensor histidine kinase YesM